MSVTHMVMLKFKAAAKPEDIRSIAERFLDFEKSCVRPDTQKPYILKVRGGKDLSLNPPFASGPTHGFVLEFASIEDRKYFVNKDPVHAAFVEDIKLLMEKLTIVDFHMGVF